MTVQTIVAQTPIVWTSIGPLAQSERWTVADLGELLVTTEAVVDNNQGILLKRGIYMDIAAGTTAFVRSPGSAVLNREVGMVADVVVNRDNTWFSESTTAQAALATFTGASRNIGAAAGVPHRYSAFNAIAIADQSGTIRIEASNDGTTWRKATGDIAFTATAPGVLSIPVMAQFHRVVVVNGATLQGLFMCNTSLTAA
jgi:hypothetical protein